VAFAERLPAFPIVLEVVPPHRRASDKALAGLVKKVQDAVDSIPHLDALNIPEVLDENHAGLPFYRNLGPRDFAQQLTAGLRVEPIVNKVVVHTEGREDLGAWLRESIDVHGLRNFILVGGTSSRIAYPGPDVVAANEILGKVSAGRRDVVCGNITIPERAGEVERLLRKTRAGARFFTTQVLFEPEPISTVLREYGEACAAARVTPATVLLSFAPVADYEDIEFLVWLGATITPETEEALIATRGREAGRGSFDVARRIWTRIRDANAKSRHPVPLGVNIEEISVHNFDLAVRMAREFPAWKDAKAPTPA
jgi:5,10-methylenetetrahydrofolate reductase